MKYVVSLGAIAALMAGTGFAADLPSRKEPVYVPPPPPILWTGFYGGLNLGGGWRANNDNGATFLPFTDPRFPIGAVVAGTPNLFFLPGGGNTNNNSGGIVGGGQIGYNYQFGTSIVIGAEADIQGTSITGGDNGNNIFAFPSPFAPAGGVLVPLGAGFGDNIALPWFGTVRGRAGWLFTPTLLIYGTGGFAYGEVTAFNFSNTRTGWTAGGGVEWMFMPNWSAKVEYLFVDLSSGGATGPFGFTFGSHRHPQLNVVRAGVNYHFNFGSPAPVLAKY